MLTLASRPRRLPRVVLALVLTRDVLPFLRKQAGDLVIKMLTSDPPIVFKRIIDKKTGKPRLAVTRENIVEQVRVAPSSVVSQPSRVMRHCHLIASRLCLNGRIHANNP